MRLGRALSWKLVCQRCRPKALGKASGVDTTCWTVLVLLHQKVL